MFIPKRDIEEIVGNLRSLNHRFDGKTILVLGCFGFLGKMVLSYLFYLNDYVLRSPCKIIGTDNFIVGKMEETEHEHFRFIRHDICDPLWMLLPASTPVHHIWNFCGIADPKKYCLHKLVTFKIGTLGTINTLEYASYKNAESALLFSSSEVYGNPDDANIPTPETYNGNLPSTGERACYDESKRCILTLADIFHKTYGVNTKIILPFNVISAGMSINDGRVVPTYVRKLLQGEKMPVFGGGKETRTLCYGTDFITGIILAVLTGKPGGAWNIGNSNNEISMIDLAKKMEEISGMPDSIANIPYPSVYKKQPQRRCPSIELAKSELGYNPAIDLTESLRRYWDWAKSIPTKL